MLKTWPGFVLEFPSEIAASYQKDRNSWEIPTRAAAPATPKQQAGKGKYTDLIHFIQNNNDDDDYSTAVYRSQMQVFSLVDQLSQFLKLEISQCKQFPVRSLNLFVITCDCSYYIES